jgi:chorismate mutase
MFVSVVRKSVMNPADPELRDIRRAIDGVDAAIATLLASRRRLSHLAILTKAREGLPIVDPIREGEIKQRYERTAHGASIVARAIFRWCRGHHEPR